MPKAPGRSLKRSGFSFIRKILKGKSKAAGANTASETQQTIQGISTASVADASTEGTSVRWDWPSEAERQLYVPNGIWIDIPNRRSDMPPVYRVQEHPLCLGEAPTGNIYVYLDDLTLEGMKRRRDAGVTFKVPRGPPNETLRQGE